LGIIQDGSTQYYVHDFRASVQKKAIEDTQDLTQARMGIMQVRGLVQWQVGKQVSRIANLWGNSVVDGCMVGSRSVLALRRGCVRPREHYTCFAIENAVNRSKYVQYAAMQ
jgi:hypothetical protein